MVLLQVLLPSFGVLLCIYQSQFCVITIDFDYSYGVYICITIQQTPAFLPPSLSPETLINRCP